MVKRFEVIIIGAGAAGMLCAIEAGKRGKKVLIIDHSKKIGEKIRISGGGRCNFTNINTNPSKFISSNPNFCISALKQYTQNDFINLVKKYDIKFHEKKLGQLFCDNSSQQIIDMLLEECKSANVILKNETSVSSVTKIENEYFIQTNLEDYVCDSLVIASGGLSIPKIGATNFGYQIAKQFNHKIKFLTLYTFSSENWKRPKTEITFLFKLLENFLKKKINKIIEKDIKLKFIGELNKLPVKLQKLIKLSEKKTFNKKTLHVNIALNYGSKIELINTIKKIKEKKIIINEKNIDNNLYTKHLPNPDILIRTGNTHRLSNFLLWQLSYTEIFFEKKLWPDFKGKDFDKIMNKFKNIKRNFGSI